MTFPTNPLDITEVYSAVTYTLVAAPSDSSPNDTQNWFIIGDGIGYSGANDLFIGNSREVPSRDYAVVSFCAFGQSGPDSEYHLMEYLPTGLVSLCMMPYIMVRASDYYYRWYTEYRLAYEKTRGDTYSNGVTE